MNNSSFTSLQTPIFNKYQRKFRDIIIKSEPNYKDKGDVLELFIALRDFSKTNLNKNENENKNDSSDTSGNEYILLYEDVPDEIKNKYSLTYKDTGIDLIKIDYSNMKILEIIQCKNYSRRLSHHKLGTFYYWILKLHEYDNNIKCRLIINDKTRYNGELENLKVEIVSTSDIYEYIESNFEFIFSFNQTQIAKSFVYLMKQINNCLNKFNLIYSNSDSIKIVIDPNTLNDIDEVCYFDNINVEIETNKEKMKRNKLFIIFIIIIILFVLILIFKLIL